MHRVELLLRDSLWIGGGWRNLPFFHERSKPKTQRNHTPVLLIPGLLSNWWDMYSIADVLERKGHQVVYAKSIGWNTKPIPEVAARVNRIILDNDFKEVIFVSHSKGGLVGKYVMANLPGGERVRKMITVATPFEGVESAYRVPVKFIRELHSGNETMRKLRERKDINRRIVSLAARVDLSVGDPQNCFLEDGENIVLPHFGHHIALYHPSTIELIAKKLTEG